MSSYNIPSHIYCVLQSLHSEMCSSPSVGRDTFFKNGFINRNHCGCPTFYRGDCKCFIAVRKCRRLLKRKCPYARVTLQQKRLINTRIQWWKCENFGFKSRRFALILYLQRVFHLADVRCIANVCLVVKYTYCLNMFAITANCRTLQLISDRYDIMLSGQ